MYTHTITPFYNLLWPVANTVDTRAIYLCATSTYPGREVHLHHIYRPWHLYNDASAAEAISATPPRRRYNARTPSPI